MCASWPYVEEWKKHKLNKYFVSDYVESVVISINFCTYSSVPCILVCLFERVFRWLVCIYLFVRGHISTHTDVKKRCVYASVNTCLRTFMIRIHLFNIYIYIYIYMCVCVRNVWMYRIHMSYLCHTHAW